MKGADKVRRALGGRERSATRQSMLKHVALPGCPGPPRILPSKARAKSRGNNNSMESLQTDEGSARLRLPHRNHKASYQRCTVCSFSAICAARAVLLSTICASSRHTRHQRRRVSGVGMICRGWKAALKKW